ncbi:MAG: hypothetical protein LUQ60_01490 [Methanomicrobiales archaeon]|nr:hypothetical protein [Methanomicrobiales archaeon]
MNPLPSFGVHSALVFGGTLTTTTAVKKFGGKRDFDLLISVLIKGIGVFTVVIAVWLGIVIF